MERLISGARQLLGIELSATQLAAFRTYARELDSWNQKFNLTAIKTPAEVETKHFLDSVTCLLAIRAGRPAHAISLIDVGAGAGFPGLPLKIVCPEMRLMLVESVGKKVTFLEHLTRTLGLKDVTVLKARAEEVGQEAAHREKYDWAVARAVAEMRTLLEYLLPLVKVGGRVLAQKGENAPAEAHGAEHAARLLGGCLAQVTPVELPGVAEQRFLVVYDKAAATPGKYPRRPGVPGKEPLA
jgi:16S rRNA (guanine527-N7)-methyltransferase